MQSGYDVMTSACCHFDYEQITENAHYIMCDVCGNGETLCSKCVDEAVEDSKR